MEISYGYRRLFLMAWETASIMTDPEDPLNYVGLGPVDDVVPLAKNIPTRWGPATGYGPLGRKIAMTFRGASYTEQVLEEPLTLYRVYGGEAGMLGSYWTRTPPSGPLQSRMDLALRSEWGNSATNVVKIEVPKGTTVYEGFAAPQNNGIKSFSEGESLPGGGSQIYIPKVNPEWIINE